MLAPDWSWLDTVPVVLFAVALFLVPGGVFCRLLGLRDSLIWGAAPLLSTSMIVVGGIVASRLSIPWGLGTLLGFIALVWLAGAVIRRIVGDEPFDAALDPPVSVKAAATGLSTAFMIATLILVTASGSPGNFPQQPDVIPHLGLTTAFMEDRDISTLTGHRFVSETNPTFYHAAVHAVAATVGLLTGAPPVVAMSSTILVVVGLVFPAGMLFLWSRITSTSTRALVFVAPLIAVGFFNLPWRKIGLGPTWPLTLGDALIPAALGLLLIAFRRGPSGVIFSQRAFTALVVGAPGLAAAHLSAAMAIPAFAWFWVMENLMWLSARWQARKRWVIIAAAMVVSAIAVAAGVAVAPENRLQFGDQRGSIRLALLGGVTWGAEREPLALALGFLLFVAAIAGAMAVWRTRRARWLIATWTMFLALSILAGGLGSDATRWLTWPWLNGPNRLGALAVIAGAPLAVSGVVLAVEWLRCHRPLGVLTIPVAGLALAGLVVGQAIVIQPALAAYYRATGSASWVTAEEISALRRISAVLPDDALVAANPLNGATYLALVGPERLLIPTDQARSESIVVLGGHLDDLASVPYVCRVVKDTGVTHVITGGDPNLVTWVSSEVFAGIDGVSGAKGFTRIAVAGPYTLYEIEPCNARGAPL